MKWIRLKSAETKTELSLDAQIKKKDKLICYGVHPGKYAVGLLYSYEKFSLTFVLHFVSCLFSCPPETSLPVKTDISTDRNRAHVKGKSRRIQYWSSGDLSSEHTDISRNSTISASKCWIPKAIQFLSSSLIYFSFINFVKADCYNGTISWIIWRLFFISYHLVTVICLHYGSTLMSVINTPN